MEKDKKTPENNIEPSKKDVKKKGIELPLESNKDINNTGQDAKQKTGDADAASG